MTKPLSITAFLLGAIAIIWMAFSFLTTNILAFFVIALIALAYAIGFIELYHFHKATLKLHAALESLPETLENLDQWLNSLPSALKMPVKLRVEGDKIALPSPVLSSYLVGLLVMLGLLGTFIGMVDTLAGAVQALQGTSELEAIRAGLTAPIEGLGLAFGTSIAGVSGSAMLGFTSTLCRRERIFSARLLDQKIHSSLKRFSQSHNRQLMTTALQAQAENYPIVADLLANLTTHLEQMGDKLSETLVANQASFHENTRNQYENLATSVETTIKSGLAESAQLNADKLLPVMQTLMQSIAAENKLSQSHLQATVEQQLSALSQTHLNSAETISKSLSANIAGFEESQAGLNQQIATSITAIQANMTQQLTAITEQHVSTNQTISHTVAETVVQYDRKQETLSNKLIESFNQFSTENQQFSQNLLTNTDQQFQQLLQQQVQAENKRQLTLSSVFDAHSKSLLSTTATINTNLEQQISQSTSKLTELLSNTESLINSRQQAESQWLEQHSQRMVDIEQTLESSLQHLRSDEELRAGKALERLAQLEGTVTEHLSNLGQALEEPMSRMIEIASETPKAAAEVISQLREEISKNIERDNSLLEERQRTMQQLSSVSEQLHKTQTDQSQAIQSMVERSATMLSDLSEKINQQFEQELSTLSNSANTVVESSIELSSLSEGFSQAINHFSETNTALVGNLQQLEQRAENNQSQNNEQLNYYVAQAREVIDHSLASQQAIIQQIHQLSAGNKSEDA